MSDVFFSPDNNAEEMRVIVKRREERIFSHQRMTVA